MIVMDASGSINAADWVKAKDYARIIVNGLSPFMAQNKTRVGVISFSSKATLEIPLTFDTHLAQGVINGLNKTTGTTRFAPSTRKAHCILCSKPYTFYPHLLTS